MKCLRSKLLTMQVINDLYGSNTMAQLSLLFAECVQFLPWGWMCTLVHMNTLQRVWIFQGWCENAARGRFVMWFLERARLSLQRYVLLAAKKKKKKSSCNPPLLALFLRISIYLENFFSSRFVKKKESSELGSYIRQHQALTHFDLLARWTQHGEILSVCICFCPSSPTTRQSIVMHVRWPIYSSHLHCVLGTWHWSSSSQCWCGGT